MGMGVRSILDSSILALTQSPPECVRWVNSRGNPTGASMKPLEVFQKCFRDPDHFRAGELHNHVNRWGEIVGDLPSPAQQARVVHWVREKVSVEEYFRPFQGDFKGKSYYDSAIHNTRNEARILNPGGVLTQSGLTDSCEFGNPQGG